MRNAYQIALKKPLKKIYQLRDAGIMGGQYENSQTWVQFLVTLESSLAVVE